MILSRKAWAALVVLVMAVSLLPAVPAPVSRAAGSSAPSALSIQVAPAVIPADGGVYHAIYVSLVDSSGSPTLAVSDVTVFLTSSTSTIGIVLNSTVTIAAGEGYAVAEFQSTPTVGSTRITASASGLASATATVTTAAPTGYPTSINVIPVPSEVNSTSTSSRKGILIVEFQDQNGQPAKAAVNTPVSVYSSSPQILVLNETSFTMKAGQFLKVVSFSTGFIPGAATVTASASQINSGTAQVTVLGRPPLALKLYAQPDQMVTPGFGNLVIALTDLSGNPTRAPNAIEVQIRSSNTSVVTAPTQATIPAGNIYTTVTMTSTNIQGSAKITASASGLETGFANVATFTPSGTPFGLKLFVGPTPVLADHGSYNTIVVSLVNETGSPAVSASTSYDVILTSSRNSSVGEFGSSYFTIMTIPQGQNDVVWSVPFTSTFTPGTTSLTVSGQNLLPDTGTITTFGSTPSKISIASLFPVVPADGTSHPALQVSLEDSFGGPAVAPSNVYVYLSSSQIGIAQVSSPVVINAGESATVVDVTTTAVSGEANLTAYTNSLSSGYAAASTIIQTATPSPSAIGAYLAPSVMAPSPNQRVASLVLQLQDSQGNPSKARSDTEVTVTSADTSVFNQTLHLQIPEGESYVVIPITPLASGSTTFTVTSPGFAAATVKLTVLTSPFAVQISAFPFSVIPGGAATATLSVTVDGQPVSGANVTWSSTYGSVSPVSSLTNAQGQSLATFTGRSLGEANITAVVKSLIGGTQVRSAFVFVTPPPKPSPSLVETLLSFPYILIIVAAAAVAVLTVFLVFRRRKRSREAEAAISEEDELSINSLRSDPGLGVG